MLHAERPTEPAEPVTWEDYIALPEDDLRELIDGVLVEVEVPTFLHEWIIAQLLIDLGLWTRENGGVAIGSGYKVRVGEDRAYMPDLQLFRRVRPALLTRFMQGLTEGAPDLVVEIISPSSGRYDRVTKFNGYAAIGCPEYWLIDPESRLLEQFVLEGEHYRLTQRLADDAVFEPATLPGLKVPLASLWTMPGAEEASTD